MALGDPDEQACRALPGHRPDDRPTYICSTQVPGSAVSCAPTAGRFRRTDAVDVVLGKAGHLQLLQLGGGDRPMLSALPDQPVFGAVLGLATHPTQVSDSGCSSDV